MAAHLLYRRVAEYFPQSPLAAEAAWRSADIRWQLDKQDISTLPSAKEQEAYLRPQLFDSDMKKVIKTYPGSKYAALAAYDMLDNKLCGDWQGLPKCPEMEAGLYEKYARQYPDSPKAAEALYNATYREGVVVTMYMVQEDKKKSDEAAGRTQALAQDLKAQYPQSDFTARAASIAYRVQQGVPIYGNDRE
jgi:outer membrane protein assembly factor BamD (BamD/ComL family)